MNVSKVTNSPNEAAMAVSISLVTSVAKTTVAKKKQDRDGFVT